jgi:hypothetical protein
VSRPQTRGGSSAERGGYNRQLIVALTMGGQDDAAVLAQADALDRKRRDPALPSEVVVVHRGPGPDRWDGDADADELRSALTGQRRVGMPVDGQSRLYLVGAGDAAERTLAGWGPAALAALLAGAGLRTLALLSIVGDGAGRDPDRDEAAQLDPDATSFASLLHRALREDHSIVTKVNARIGAVRVQTSATASGNGVIEAGRKLTSPHPATAASEHHAASSKLHLRWEGERQLREWSY